LGSSWTPLAVTSVLVAAIGLGAAVWTGQLGPFVGDR
jgi:hypothetical protein